jgi:predicted nucleic acid-binding protein
MLLAINIVGYFFRRDSRARLHERHLTGRTLYIAFATLGELSHWLFLRPFCETKRHRLLAHISPHVVVPYDDRPVWVWADLTAKIRQAGRFMSVEDSWIAATALRHGMPFVTHNRMHFENVPVWSDSVWSTEE